VSSVRSPPLSTSFFSFRFLFFSFPSSSSVPFLSVTCFPSCYADTNLFFLDVRDSAIVIILRLRLLYVDPDRNSLLGPTRIGKTSPNPQIPSRNLHSARSDGGGTVDAAASTKDWALQPHHLSSTVLVLEDAIAAVRNDASQLPRSDILHASTVIRDLENVLREKLSRRGPGDDEEM
jgi:hypothetical protein